MSLWAGLASLAGAGISYLGNKSAADSSAAGSREMAQAIREGNQQAQGRFDRAFTAGEPGIERLQQEATADGGLTPLQEQNLTDARRKTENSLAGSGFRGSGRARVSALRGVEGSLRNQMLESNKATSRAASGQLASGAFGANAGSANAFVNEGRDLARIQGDAADTSANQSIANASLASNTIGDLSAIFDPGIRKSRYAAGQTASALRSYYT